jgi:hypothetical protein
MDVFKAIDNSIGQFLDMDNIYQKINIGTIAHILVTVTERWLQHHLTKEVLLRLGRSNGQAVETLASIVEGVSSKNLNKRDWFFERIFRCMK